MDDFILCEVLHPVDDVLGVAKELARVVQGPTVHLQVPQLDKLV